MRARRISLAVVALLIGAAALSASGALTGSAKAAAAAGDGSGCPCTVVDGSQPEGTPEMVDGVPVAQAAAQTGGTYVQGTPVTFLTNPGPVPAGIQPDSPNGCHTAAVHHMHGEGGLTQTVWEIWNHTHWCFNQWRVTSVTGWTDTYTAIGWSVLSHSSGLVLVEPACDCLQQRYRPLLFHPFLRLRRGCSAERPHLGERSGELLVRRFELVSGQLTRS